MEKRRIGGGKFDVHALLELLESGGTEQRRPALGIAVPAGDERFRQDRPQPGVQHIVGVGRHHFLAEITGVGLGGLVEDREKILAHQRLVIADRPVGDQRGAEVRIQVALRVVGLRAAFQPLRVHIGEAARQFDIFEESCRIINTLHAVVIEPLIEYLRLERVECGRQGLGITPQPVQPRLALGGVKRHIHIGRRRELAHPGLDKGGMGRQRRNRLGQGLELGRQQRPVNVELAESAGLRRLEVGDDKLRQVRHVGPLESRQQRTPLLRAERGPRANQ